MININNPKNKPLHREAYLYRAYGGKRAKSHNTMGPQRYNDIDISLGIVPRPTYRAANLKGGNYCPGSASPPFTIPTEGSKTQKRKARMKLMTSVELRKTTPARIGHE
jgi:hypothetical protein